MKERMLSTEAAAAILGMSESALRSWINGNREINLTDFFRLCAAIKADPRQMLFGSPALSAEQRQALGEVVASVLENDVALHPNYSRFVDRLQKDLTKRKK